MSANVHPLLRLLAGSLLLLFCAGCGHKPTTPDWVPFQTKAPVTPLSEVVPGRWVIVVKGLTYHLAFGQHSEMNLLVDVPPQYRARVGVDQIWAGGNYHVENDQVINCQLTNGRWAVLLAQMEGLPLRHIGVKSYTQDEITDAEDAVWKRVDHTTAGRTGEAVDVAEQAPTVSDAPRANSPGSKGRSAPQSLSNQQGKLTALYNRLETRRRKLNLKDKAAVAAFNKEAANYTREVADFNGGANRPVANSPAVTTAR